MKYWAHLNNEVKGPFEAAALCAVPGFTPGTQVFPDGAAPGTPWKPASAFPDLLAALTPAPEQPSPPAPAPAKAAPPDEDKLMLTMRGSLVDPELKELMEKQQAAQTAAAKPAVVTSGKLEPRAEAPAAAPAPAPAAAAEELRAKLDRLAAELAAVSKEQAGLAGRLEAAAQELKALRG